MEPWQKLGLSMDTPNAVLCSYCHQEKITKDGMCECDALYIQELDGLLSSL